MSLHYLVTAGPTREPVDDVRYLSNASSGRMGFAVARAAAAEGHRVTLVCGPTSVPPPADVDDLRPVTTALEMRDAVLSVFEETDVVVMTAAVADYRPETRIRGKRKKAEGPWTLRLVENPDILAELGERKGDRVLVGFALEAEDAERNAEEKLRRKNLDLVVMNDPDTIGADESDFTVLHSDGARDRYISVSKDFLALRLVSLAANVRLKRQR